MSQLEDLVHEICKYFYLIYYIIAHTVDKLSLKINEEREKIKSKS